MSDTGLTRNRLAPQEYGIRGFPTIKYFGPNKSSPSDYDSARDTSAIVAFALSKWEKYAPAAEVGLASATTPLTPLLILPGGHRNTCGPWLLRLAWFRSISGACATICQVPWAAQEGV